MAFQHANGRARLLGLADQLHDWGTGVYAPDVPTHMRHCREAAAALRDLVEALSDNAIARATTSYEGSPQ